MPCNISTKLPTFWIYLHIFWYVSIFESLKNTRLDREWELFFLPFHHFPQDCLFHHPHSSTIFHICHISPQTILPLDPKCILPKSDCIWHFSTWQKFSPQQHSLWQIWSMWAQRPITTWRKSLWIQSEGSHIGSETGPPGRRHFLSKTIIMIVLYHDCIISTIAVILVVVTKVGFSPIDVPILSTERKATRSAVSLFFFFYLYFCIFVSAVCFCLFYLFLFLYFWWQW